jgi:hypothetical protein
MRFSTIAMIALAATASHAQSGPGGRGAFGPMAGQSRGAGPRPVLLGFALECTKCSATGRGGRGVGGRGGMLSTWHYDEYPRVAAVADGSAAQRAGIRTGDVLMSVDGLSILANAGSDRFGELRAGDSVHLMLDRDGKTINVDLVLNRGRGGGTRADGAAPANEPSFSTRTQGTKVDVWSDTPVVETTDSTGATVLRIGNIVVRLTSTSDLGVGRGNRGRRGAAPPQD